MTWLRTIAIAAAWLLVFGAGATVLVPRAARAAQSAWAASPTAAWAREHCGIRLIWIEDRRGRMQQTPHAWCKFSFGNNPFIRRRGGSNSARQPARPGQDPHNDPSYRSLGAGLGAEARALDILSGRPQGLACPTAAVAPTRERTPAVRSRAGNLMWRHRWPDRDGALRAVQSRETGSTPVRIARPLGASKLRVNRGDSAPKPAAIWSGDVADRIGGHVPGHKPGRFAEVGLGRKCDGNGTTLFVAGSNPAMPPYRVGDTIVARGVTQSGWNRAGRLGRYTRRPLMGRREEPNSEREPVKSGTATVPVQLKGSWTLANLKCGGVTLHALTGNRAIDPGSRRERVRGRRNRGVAGDIVPAHTLNFAGPRAGGVRRRGGLDVKFMPLMDTRIENRSRARCSDTVRAQSAR